MRAPSKPASPLRPLTHLPRWARITIHHLRPSKCKCDIRPTCHQNHSHTVNDVLPSHLGLNLRVNLSSKFELRHDRYYFFFPFSFLAYFGLIAGDKEALFLTLSVLFFGQQHHRSTPCNVKLPQISSMKRRY